MTYDELLEMDHATVTSETEDAAEGFRQAEQAVDDAFGDYMVALADLNEARGAGVAEDVSACERAVFEAEAHWRGCQAGLRELRAA